MPEIQECLSKLRMRLNDEAAFAKPAMVFDLF
jgi:hypothetical protein